MRIRTAVATVGIALAGAAAAATASAGSAAAFTPYVNPGFGGIYVGVDLNHNETVALAHSPIPALIDQVNMANNRIVLDPFFSQIPEVGDTVYADLPDIVGEAANTPGGQVSLAVVDPAQHTGGNLLVIQDLGGWNYLY